MRRHRTATLAMILAALSACGGGELGEVALPTTTPSSTTQEVTLPSNADTISTTTTVANSSPTTSITGTSTSGTSTSGGSTSTTSESSSPIQVPEAILAAVIEDAADRQSIDPSAVTVVSGQPVDWSDGSLGCPEPGRSYIQVITPGYLVVVEANGVSLEYHLNRQGGFKQCTGGTFYPPSDY